MRIAICEDEWVQQNMLEAQIWAFDTNRHYEICKFFSGEELVAGYEEGARFDIIFMDVCLKKMDGIETGSLIQKFDKEVKIILTTSMIEYAMKGYKIKAYDFLLKPIDPKNLKRVFERVLSAIEDSKIMVYCVNLLDEKICLPVDEISYLESEKRKINVHTKDKVYTCYAKLSEEALKLSKMGFVQTHQSFLVNMSYFSKINPDEIELKDGSMIPISRRRYKAVYDDL